MQAAERPQAWRNPGAHAGNQIAQVMSLQKLVASLLAFGDESLDRGFAADVGVIAEK
ncbi:hypothetical protein [Novosphingobium sp. FKTRR1]|uniref:hypothetical protein n=1 Tax=Novosphingobium sp. FKTRR1 TaxID=2879118 RepID=UPI001CF0583B|nr:hypothetical protein [Novosphingobium sp. FKTRR1]